VEEKNMPDDPGKSGLLAGAEVIKYLTALGTGAIVFSSGLLSDKVFLPTGAKWFMFGAWCLLALSVLAGLIAGMRIPIQLAEENYNVEDVYLKYPGMIQQIAFFFGVLSLGIALTLILIGHGTKLDTQPGAQPTVQPTVQPTIQPTIQPTVQPTIQPTVAPTPESTVLPGLPFNANR
jgi:hypothetical protein